MIITQQQLHTATPARIDTSSNDLNAWEEWVQEEKQQAQKIVLFTDLDNDYLSLLGDRIRALTAQQILNFYDAVEAYNPNAPCLNMAMGVGEDMRELLKVMEDAIGLECALGITDPWL